MIICLSYNIEPQRKYIQGYSHRLFEKLLWKNYQHFYCPINFIVKRKEKIEDRSEEREIDAVERKYKPSDPT